MSSQTPILYSFRRCPYAMRARLAIDSSQVKTELREVVLRDKPPSFLAASPSATVPCLVHNKGVIDESLDIMKWSLNQHDPESWLIMPDEGSEWIERCDGPFKVNLDRTKYITRYPNADEKIERRLANEFLSALDEKIDTWIFDRPTLADYAILPFVRQFANIDIAKFQDGQFHSVAAWLDRFTTSEKFSRIMQKHSPWHEKTQGNTFPPF
ncbi:glutathione S-transferase [uncultured Pelagimonas sp.]|uniref:glutathione S-transferase n=1 Tax=uncultured Pelagimonas sp. TaxID=1618102 RepID=UPI002627C708|nr:glutathione S-transferase [uncultured Pelagimonas sp.]